MYLWACLLGAIEPHAQVFEDASVAAGFYGTNSSWAGAWADYDNDGDLDVITTGHVQSITDSISQLWRNNGYGMFTDVTVAAGLNPTNSDPHGALWADLDNDGDVDLFICHGGSKTLTNGNLHEVYLNTGNGKFTNIAMSTGASALGINHHGRGVFGVDYNRDGRLDIYSPGYSKAPTWIGPRSLLYRNLGGMHFAEVGQAARLDRSIQPNRVAPWADFDDDGWPDVLTLSSRAYDGLSAGLFRNQGDGTFRDVTAGSGLASSTNCENAAWADYDNDGDFDAYITTNDNTPGILERNNGDGTFTEVTAASGLVNSSYAEGLAWGDYDNDGDPDLYIVNVYHGAQPNRLFHNNGDGSFTDVAASARVEGRVPGNGADATFVDYDNDGDLDLFVTNGWGNQKGPYLLFRNGGNRNHWLKIQLVGTVSNRDGIMTKVRVITGGQTQLQQYHGPMHFMSQDKTPLHFGLGTAMVVDRIELIWPSGALQQLENVAVNQTIKIVEPCMPSPCSITTITATDDIASEPGHDTVRFRVTRTGSTDASLRVFYTVRGTAKAGTDYKALKGFVTIPPGSKSATFQVTPSDDSQKEPTETVEVSLSPNAGYLIGPPYHAMVNILDDD